MYQGPGTFLCRGPYSVRVRIHPWTRTFLRTASSVSLPGCGDTSFTCNNAQCAPGARASSASDPVVAAAVAADLDWPRGSGASAASAARERPRAAFRLACRQRGSSTSHTSVCNGSGWAPCPAVGAKPIAATGLRVKDHLLFAFIATRKPANATSRRCSLNAPARTSSRCAAARRGGPASRARRPPPSRPRRARPSAAWRRPRGARRLRACARGGPACP